MALPIIPLALCRAYDTTRDTLLAADLPADVWVCDAETEELLSRQPLTHYLPSHHFTATPTSLHFSGRRGEIGLFPFNLRTGAAGWIARRMPGLREPVTFPMTLARNVDGFDGATVIFPTARLAAIAGLAHEADDVFAPIGSDGLWWRVGDPLRKHLAKPEAAPQPFRRKRQEAPAA